MALARAAASPLTLRFFETIPLRPASVGLLLVGGLIAIFFLQEFALGRHTLFLDPDDPSRTPRNVRITVFGCLQLGYLTTAYVYLVRGARDTLARLRPVLVGEPEELAQLEATAGRYDPTGLRVAALVGVSVGLLMPYVGEGENFYTWAANSPETLWHRVTAPLLGYWVARLMFAVLSESRRLSELAGRLAPLDLFDLRPLTPFTRQGLTHALVIVGFGSIQSLNLIESGFGPMLSFTWALTAGVAIIGLLVPVNGVRKRIRNAKVDRLETCREDLRRAQASLDASGGDAELTRVANLLALRQHLSEIREWPFDASTLRRLALYLLIPLGSWSGGALVERLIDAALD